MSNHQAVFYCLLCYHGYCLVGEHCNLLLRFHLALVVFQVDLMEACPRFCIVEGLNFKLTNNLE